MTLCHNSITILCHISITEYTHRLTEVLKGINFSGKPVEGDNAKIEEIKKILKDSS